MSATLTYAESITQRLRLDCPWQIGQTIHVRNDPTVTDELETLGVVTGLRYIDNWGWRIFIDDATAPRYGDHRCIPSHTPGNRDAWEADDPDLSATSWAVLP